MPAGFPIDHSTIHDRHQDYMCALGSGVVDWSNWAKLYEQTEGRGVRLLELDAVASPVAEMKAAKSFLELNGI